MVLFPIAVIWLIVVIVWVVRNSQNAAEAPGDHVWRRWRPKPRRPRDDDVSGARGRARKRASASKH